MDTSTLIPEILRAFLEAEREFLSWLRSGAKTPPKRNSVSSSSNGTAKAQP